jgi:hypothetical protein
MNVGCKQQLFRDGLLRREFDLDFSLLEQSLAERIESQCHPKGALKGNLMARSISSGITIYIGPRARARSTPYAPAFYRQ